MFPYLFDLFLGVVQSPWCCLLWLFLSVYRTANTG